MVKNSPAKAGDTGDAGSIPGSGRSPRDENGNPPQDSFLFFTPVFLPGKSHVQRSLVGYIPWDCRKSVTAERAHTLPSMFPGNQ